MKAAFVANVGSRDVQVNSHKNLSKDSRTLGEQILSNWDELRPNLDFPILMKALAYADRRPDDIESIILFASDQPADSKYHHTDTMPFAHVISRYVREEFGDIMADKIRLVTIAGNPASYDDMLGFYGPQLELLNELERVYLHVSGGTPAMSFMLLWQGVNVLGRKAYPLYVIQEEEKPLRLNIGNKLLLNALVDDLLDAISTYQYHAAEQILHKNADILREELTNNVYKLVRQLTQHARHRRNFRFDLAQDALDDADRNASQSHEDEVIALMHDIKKRDAIWVMREEYFAAQLAAQNGAYRNMLFHIFSFVETLQTQYAIQLGVQVGEKSKWDMEWLDTQPELKAFLLAEGINFSLGMNSYATKAVIKFYAQSNKKQAGVNKLLDNASRLRDLRNAITHSHAGVSQRDIEDAYKKPLDELLNDMQAMYRNLTGRPIGDNPFERVNDLIKTLLTHRQA